MDYGALIFAGVICFGMVFALAIAPYSVRNMDKKNDR